MLITPDYNPTGALKGVNILLMSAQSASGTRSTVVCPGPGIKNHTLNIRVSAAVTGAIQLETANDPNYTGIWAPLGGGPIDLATAGAGGELEFRFSNITITAVRARITTIVVGGNVSVEYLGQ